MFRHTISLFFFQYEIDFLRIGRLQRIHPDIRPYAAEALTEGITTVKDLADFYQSKVGAKCGPYTQLALIVWWFKYVDSM